MISIFHLRRDRTGQRAFDEAASLRPPISMRAKQSCRGRPTVQGRWRTIMAENNKLSVEKALQKIRARDAKQSKGAPFDDKIYALSEQVERMRTQRLRLERHQLKRKKNNP